MKVVTAADIDRLLDPSGLADALAEAFRSDIVVPMRHHHEVERPGDEATLLLMPAWTGKSVSPAYVGTKIVSIYRGNAARGLPSVMGSYLLNDGATGAPLAVMDGSRLTVWRTAAASAAATRALARTRGACNFEILLKQNYVGLPPKDAFYSTLEQDIYLFDDNVKHGFIFTINKT